MLYKILRLSGSLSLVILGSVLACVLAFRYLPDIHVPVVQAQDNEGSSMKTVGLDMWARSCDAVRVVSVTENGQTIDAATPKHPGTPFADPNNDWLKNLSVTLKNYTSKNIAFAVVVLHFPQTKSAGPEAAWDVQLGRIPANDAYSPTGEALPLSPDQKPLNFGPGQTLTISFAAYEANVRQMLAEQPTPEVTEAAIQLGEFLFDDGSQWNPSGYRLPDGDHPGRYINIPRELGACPFGVPSPGSVKSMEEGGL